MYKDDLSFIYLLIKLLIALVHNFNNCGKIYTTCLENPRDRGAWWAAVYRVPQSWTRLK